jgi:nucleoside-triphosphatase
LKKRILLLTGNPSVGKTTVLLKAVEALRARGYSVGGMVSREVRSCGERVGFEILDLSSNSRGWLARVNQPSGPRVGKYSVNLNDLDNIGAGAIVRAVKGCDVVCVNEIGPMELFSEKFKEAVRQAVEGEKLVVGVVHWKAKDKLIDEVKARKDVEIIVVTVENRGKLHEFILEKAIEFLNFKKSQRK